MNLNELKNTTGDWRPSETFPLLFVGHGNPMNAILNNPFTQRLTSWGAELSLRPRAILVISAHWLSRGTHVSVTPKPSTIHDFGGFPSELYSIQYPAPGAPDIAREAVKMITSLQVVADINRGLDHGAWTILKHLYPDAEIPVFQLSIDYYQSLSWHYDLAAELKELRHKGVLIIGSGNIVHNLYQVDFNENAKPFPWALEFDEMVQSNLMAGDFKRLNNPESFGTASKLAVPTPDHYIPMLYTLGLADPSEKLELIYREIQNAAVSMLSFQIG
jgi:4,5-DOPA dioxygenase extradiol